MYLCSRKRKKLINEVILSIVLYKPDAGGGASLSVGAENSDSLSSTRSAHEKLASY